MGSTVWIPKTRYERQRWLLANGEIITEPLLEETSSGRKIRVAGTTDSVYASEFSGLLERAAKTVAAQRGTHVWMQMPDDLGILIRNVAGLKPEDMNRAKLHLVHEPTVRDTQTVCYWRFKDSASPYEVMLVAQMQPQRGLTVQKVSIRLCLPYALYGINTDARVIHVLNDHFSELLENSLGRHGSSYEWTEFVRDNPPDWPTTLLGETTHSYARPAVTQFLKAIHAFEELDGIQVPDLSDPDNPAYRTLELYDTNVNAELLSDLAEYVDGAPTMESVANQYQQMLDTLRSVGINVGAKSENDFMAALLAGEKETLNMKVTQLAEEGHKTDHSHRVSVHLPTGTFIVECDHAEVDRNKIAEKWEEAMTMASLTGEEDALVAYAKAYAKDRIEKRTTTIIKERATAV